MPAPAQKEAEAPDAKSAPSAAALAQRAAEKNSAGPAPVLARPSFPAPPPPVPAPMPAAPTAVSPPAAAAPPVGTTLQTRDRAMGAAAPSPARQAALPVDPLAPVLGALTGPGDNGWRDRLARLRGLTQGRWTAIDAVPPDTAEPVIDSAGRLLGRLQVDATRVLWQGADGRTWLAPLPGASDAVPAAGPASR